MSGHSERDEPGGSRPAPKPYHRPQLEELGRVNDLTLGGSGTGADFDLTDFPP